ncbi:MAG: TIR domain-containing protein [Cyanobacteria bacterium P01_C01_bin.72]
MNNFFDVFISYGRADSKDYAIALNRELTQQGLNVWFDQDDIPLAVDFQAQIDRGIEKAHNFVFIIAPHAVNSPYCLKEIELAVKFNKRIIPILHVEEISRETWQRRNPQQNEKDWQYYQEKGLNSSFTKLHPVISKINWIYSRDVDDFATAIAGLLEAIALEQEYVVRHTQLLAQALDWEKNQRQTNYLLTGVARKEAETWLKRRFGDLQPPCIPTDLHCEFISASIKNANNLMTQVFLAAATEDDGIKQKIAKTLMRQGLTIWTNQTDIKTGSAFQQEINRGIEGADTFVYLLSESALRSPYCQQEYRYAVVNQKRIIPLLIQAINLKLIPRELQKLQFIDLTQPENYCQAINKLLKELKRDAYHLENQKLLLVKALKWQRQNQNPSLLLRSYNLQHFADWLKVAQKRQDYHPLPVQSEFITESLKQPKISSLEVFISYSRVDADFARQLNDTLTEVGKFTWFDQESIATGADFQQEIYRGIEQCNNFLFVISPAAIASKYCNAEVEYAHSLNKRIITVVYQPVAAKDLPPTLAKIQWLDFSQNKLNFAAHFPTLVRALDTDREHVQYHTKWSQRAREWLQRDKSDDLLLRGSEFVLAQNWLEATRQEHKQPPITQLQQEYIASSEKQIEAIAIAEEHRQAEILRLQQERTQEAEARLVQETKYAQHQKLLAGIATMGFVITTALGLAALFEYRISKINEVNAMSLSSEALFASHKKLDALTEAVRAKQQLQKLELIIGNAPEIRVKDALQQAVYTIKERNRLSGHYGAVLGVAFSPDGKLIASASADNSVILWEEDGSLLTRLSGHEGSVNAVTFSPDGKLIASASADNTVKLWRKDGSLVKTFRGQSDFNQVAFSNDGQVLALAAKDGTVQLRDLDYDQFKLMATLRGDNPTGSSFNAVAFSPDNLFIAAVSDDRTVKVWQRDGTLVSVLGDTQGHRRRVLNLAFSPDSQLIATASEDRTVKVWQRDGTFLRTLRGHQGSVRDVAFSPDGQRIVSGSHDLTIKLWLVDGTALQTLRGHRDRVTAVDFSLDGKYILSGSDDNSVRLWQPDNKLLKTLYRHHNSVKAVDFSPGGAYIASGSTDHTVKLWKKDGTFIRTITGHGDRVYGVVFSPDGQYLASASGDKTVRLWKKDGTLVNTMTGHGDRVYGVAFSPDGQYLASASADQTVKLWNTQGELQTTMVGHQDEVNAVVFSPNGKYIVSGSGDNTIKLWNTGGQRLMTLKGHQSTVFALDVSADGKYIVSGSGDNTIKLWTIDGEFLDSQKAHTDSVLGVKFGPDNQTIGSASVDLTIKLWRWNGKRANLETTLLGHDQAVEALDFHPHDATLASSSDDRTVILWNKHNINNLDDLLEHSCSWLSDYLAHNLTVAYGDRLLCRGVEQNEHHDENH